MELLDYIKASTMLERYGIRSVRSSYVSTPEEAIKFAGKKSIVLKLISDKALHKSKAGLIRVGLFDEGLIRNAFEYLTDRGKALKPYKIIAQEMASSGIEIIIGSNVDPQFGKMVLIGLGGIYVESFKDTSLRVCPITKNDAQDMVDQLKSSTVITYDGKSRDMIVELIVKVAKLVQDNDISELDLNPVIIRKNGYDVVDIRILK
jgi:succinyl-CoA synthetase beta subunit